MTTERERLGARPSRENPSPARSTARVTLRPKGAANVLALQRTAGNAATGVVLARRPATRQPADKAKDAKASPPATFRVLITDGGKTGLDAKTLEIAIGHVRNELKKVTSGSSNDAVKAGLMAEVILHELGHAMGHVHYEGEDDTKDHDTSGIMAPSTPIGTSGPYAPTSFSSVSAAVIRKRLEWLADRIAARAKTP